MSSAPIPVRSYIDLSCTYDLTNVSRVSIDDDIEPRGLPAQETQYKLIYGSAKLRFLKALLPQLKARGHRVLLFSQVCCYLLSSSSPQIMSFKFVIALNIVEDFLHGEGFNYLRLVRPRTL